MFSSFFLQVETAFLVSFDVIVAYEKAFLPPTRRLVNVLPLLAEYSLLVFKCAWSFGFDPFNFFVL